MPFQRDYWFAHTYDERADVIQDFVESGEEFRTFVILDSGVQSSTREILDSLMENEKIPCFVRLVIGHPDTPLEVYEYNFAYGICSKTIYVLPKLNNMARILIKRLMPVLAIFT
jgi:hypothetical protein